MKGELPSSAELEAMQGKTLNKAVRFAFRWKPRGPHLNRHPTRVLWATAAARIHEQISEPPCSGIVRQSQANKPNLISSTSRETRIDFVQAFHGASPDCIAEIGCIQKQVELRRKPLNGS